jgi:hypothetical protein
MQVPKFDKIVCDCETVEIGWGDLRCITPLCALHFFSTVPLLNHQDTVGEINKSLERESKDFDFVLYEW